MYTALCQCITESDFNPTFTINVMNPTWNIFGSSTWQKKLLFRIKINSQNCYFFKVVQIDYYGRIINDKLVGFILIDNLYIFCLIVNNFWAYKK